FLVRSVFSSEEGKALFQLGSFLIDHRSPMEERWGGWYVTGAVGTIRHMGNAVVTDMDKPKTVIADHLPILSSLRQRFDSSDYPTQFSDIVALMVFDHQTHMSNLITRIGWQTRVALQEGRRPAAINSLMRDEARELVDYLLFVDEPPLTSK